MIVTTIKVSNRLGWRSSPAAGRGLTRGDAVARAEQNLKSVRPQVLAEVDEQLQSLKAQLCEMREGAALDVERAYAACHRISSTAAVAEFPDVGTAALHLCRYLDAGGFHAVVGRLTFETAVGAMVRLRAAPSSEGPVLCGLQSLTQISPAFPAGGDGFSGIVRLIYSSVSTAPLGAFPAQVRALAGAVVARNQRDEVSGMLLADRGWYLQLLEGEAGAVAGVLISILFDRRHHDLKVLDLRLAPTRRFAAAPMFTLELKDLGHDILAGRREDFTPQALSGDAAFALLDGAARMRRA